MNVYVVTVPDHLGVKVRGAFGDLDDAKYLADDLASPVWEFTSVTVTRWQDDGESRVVYRASQFAD